MDSTTSVMEMKSQLVLNSTQDAGNIHVNSSRKAAVQKFDQELKVIRDKCRRFYIVSITEIKKRFVFDDPVFDLIEMVYPSNSRLLKPNSLAGLFFRFPRLKKFCDAKRAEEEWRTQSKLAPTVFGCDTVEEVKAMPVDVYWKIIFKAKIAGTDTHRFPNLSVCVSFLLTLPVSNVLAERLFSLLNLIKNDQRNNIDDLTMASLIRTQFWLKNDNWDPADIEITDELLESVMRVKSNATISEIVEVNQRT